MLKQRKIIHIDADAFYASVEIRENPRLANIPIAVGGNPNGRGVVATCNYIARSYGVRSAMSSAHAQRLCPDLEFIRPNFALYKTVSRDIREIFNQYTDLIEPLSLDEAYLDVTDCNLHQGSATLIAEDIRKQVKEKIGITVSAGVAPNKYLAKIASDWNKPDGIYVITPSDVDEFVFNLPVGKINGVGKVTEAKLNRFGIQTCGDLQDWDISTLSKRFGSYGPRLYELARGVDNRQVHISRERKSLSIEHTYHQDLDTLDNIIEKGNKLFAELLERCEKLPSDAVIQKRFVKVKFNDFNQTTLEEKLAASEHNWQVKSEFLRLLEQAYLRQSKPVRLLGMGVRLSPPPSLENAQQLDLFTQADSLKAET